jgi:exodeoxyribonuclease V alpha subunit
LLIVDETSMVDIMLMHYMLRALRDNSRLLLVGDADQLPSVGAGNVLRELVGCDMVPVVRLNRIFRQDEESSIVFNAHRINRGEMPVLTKKHGSSFHFVEKDEPMEVQSMLLNLCTKFIPEKFGFRTLEDIQVLSPMYRGPVGVDSLNDVLQDRLNPNPPVACGGRTFRIDDKVMQTKNNYDKEAFNGDIGTVTRIDLENRALIVKYPEHEVSYDFNDLDQVVMAYAITVHKSQGNEYPVVVIPITTQHYPMLQRNLLYTAITRARELVVLVGSKRAIAIAVKNNRIEERYSALGKRLTRELASGPGLFVADE